MKKILTVVLTVTAFAVIKAFGIDCTWRDRVTGDSEEVVIESPEDLSPQSENQ